MKKIFLVLLVASNGFAAISNDKVYKLNNSMGEVGKAVKLGTLIDEGGQRGLAKDGHQAKQLLVATYNYATHGGSSTAPISLSQVVPAKAIITRSYVDVLTQPVGAGASISVKVANDEDVLATTAVSSFTGILEGVSSGASTAFKKIASAAPVRVVITGANLTAGKFKVYLEYVMSE